MQNKFAFENTQNKPHHGTGCPEQLPAAPLPPRCPLPVMLRGLDHRSPYPRHRWCSGWKRCASYSACKWPPPTGEGVRHMMSSLTQERWSTAFLSEKPRVMLQGGQA